MTTSARIDVGGRGSAGHGAGKEDINDRTSGAA